MPRKKSPANTGSKTEPSSGERKWYEVKGKLYKTLPEAYKAWEKVK